MKNFKKYGAILLVVILLVVFCLPMVFALTDGEKSQDLFRAALAAAFLLPVLLYAILMIYQFLKKRNPSPGKDSKIQNVVFDLGNVLVDCDWKSYLEGFSFPEKTRDKIAETVFQNPLWEKRNLGLKEEEAYVNQFVSRSPRYEQEIRQVLEHSPEMVHPRPYALTWVKYLKSKGYKIYAFSNCCKYMLEENLKKLDFLASMDGTVYSYEVHHAKPEKEMYQALTQQYGLNPEKTVILDDSLVNCQAAESLGFHAVCFTDFTQATEELKKLGVE